MPHPEHQIANAPRRLRSPAQCQELLSPGFTPRAPRSLPDVGEPGSRNDSKRHGDLPPGFHVQRETPDESLKLLHRRPHNPPEPAEVHRHTVWPYLHIADHRPSEKSICNANFDGPENLPAVDRPRRRPGRIGPGPAQKEPALPVGEEVRSRHLPRMNRKLA